MKKFPVILDLETKYTFREFKEHKDLGISVGVLYDYKDNQAKTFMEHEVSQMFPILESASYIIGYNVNGFDIPVLQAYYPGDATHFETFDLLEDIREKLGRRLALNDVLSATLGLQKTSHGLMAIDMYREGRLDELKDYCLHDVLYTRDLFDYGVKTGEIFYQDERGKKAIKVAWKKYLEDNGKNDMPLTLPF